VQVIDFFFLLFAQWLKQEIQHVIVLLDLQRHRIGTLSLLLFTDPNLNWHQQADVLIRMG
jgi:hypothetical protein